MVTGIGILLAPAAGAVTAEGFFELDGNVADSNGSGVLPDDWADFYPTNVSHTLKATGIVSDTAPAVFRNGSKDTLDISTWRYDLGSSPPKDDMLHAYAAAYSVETATANSSVGDLLIYFGADRAAFNGTASLGFWFFKNPVARNDATGSFVVKGTTTPAQHADGDVLIAFEYTNGGAVTAAHKFVWRGNGVSGALVDLGVIGENPTNVPSLYCDPLDTVCGATNASAISLPWMGQILAGQLFEGGINVTKAIGGDNCFASFLATSRSSSTVNASIKNFLLGDFPVCHVSISKQCVSPELQNGGASVKYTVQGKVLNDGGGLLTNIVLTDNPALDTNSLQFYACDSSGLPTGTGSTSAPGSLAANASICYRGFITSSVFGITDTMSVSASAGSGSVVNSATATCPVPPASPGLSLQKTCDVDLAATASNTLAIKINYSGTVTNTGDVALSNVKVCETHELTVPPNTSPCDVLGNVAISIGSLAAGASANYSGSYFPSQALTALGASALADPDLAVFKDQAGAQGTPPAVFNLPVVKATPVEANCPLCK